MPESPVYASAAQVAQSFDDITAIAEMIDGRLLRAQRAALSAKAKADIKQARADVAQLVGILKPHFDDLAASAARREKVDEHGE